MSKQRLNSLQDLGKAFGKKDSGKNKAGKDARPAPKTSPPEPPQSQQQERGDDNLFADAMAHVAPLGEASRPVRGKKGAGNGPLPVNKADENFSLVQDEDLEELKKTVMSRKKQKQRDRVQQALDKSAQQPQPDPEPKSAPEVSPPAQDNDFARAMAGVAPLGRGGREVESASAPPEPNLTDKSAEIRVRLRQIVDGEIEFDLEDTEEYVQGHVKGLDPLTMNQLKAGKISYEAHLDLHGLNAMQAYEALVDFMKKQYITGKRCVLLIPGRGRNSPDGMGVLREKLQSWLTRDPFRRVVLAFCTAQQKDGGAGALYVMLRKFKKSLGKVQWDRYPTDPDLY